VHVFIMPREWHYKKNLGEREREREREENEEL
jgi:hypothetical protein